MAYPGADVLQIDDGGIERIDYRGTEQYQVTKMFLDCPERTRCACHRQIHGEMFLDCPERTLVELPAEEF